MGGGTTEARWLRLGGVGGISRGAEETASEEEEGTREVEADAPALGMKVLALGDVVMAKLSSLEVLRYSGISTQGGAGLEGIGQSVNQVQ